MSEELYQAIEQGLIAEAITLLEKNPNFLDPNNTRAETLFDQSVTEAQVMLLSAVRRERWSLVEWLTKRTQDAPILDVHDLLENLNQGKSIGHATVEKELMKW